jgi:SpoIIAA-like
MKPALLHEDKYLQILWDSQARVISVDWKESTSEMTDEDFKTELTLFAKHVEDHRAPRILIDVSKFYHRPGKGVSEWRRRTISIRYNAAGVQRFAFLLSPDSQISPTANQSSEGELFLTQAFNDREQAFAWLKASE